MSPLPLPDKLTLPARPPPLSAYVRRVLSLKPVGYWRLGEPTGRVAHDSSGDGPAGAYHGGPTPGTPRSGWIPAAWAVS
ncbi:MAG TPA: hypothetical protein VGF55_33925 [Gemmataceae bacterium]|jgi:hypothetical protein